MNKDKPKSGCLVCGAELDYLQERMELECAACSKKKWADARCRKGHFVCDECHAEDPSSWIERQCLASDLTNPVQLAIELMHHPRVAMHGPEHHFLVPAVLLTSYYNLKHQEEIKTWKIQEARRRAKNVVGGSCGFLGACGAAIGVGIFVSLVTEATPLSLEEWRLSNTATADALAWIAVQGGPRCCKRNSFIALETAAKFSAAYLDQPLPMTRITCEFVPLNRECRRQDCQYFRKNPSIR